MPFVGSCQPESLSFLSSKGISLSRTQVIKLTIRQKVGVLLMAAAFVIAVAWVITDHPSLERVIVILFDLARIFLVI